MITLLGEGSVRTSSQAGRARRGLQVRVPQYWGPTTRAGVRVRPRAEAWLRSDVSVATRRPVRCGWRAGLPGRGAVHELGGALVGIVQVDVRRAGGIERHHCELYDGASGGSHVIALNAQLAEVRGCHGENHQDHQDGGETPVGRGCRSCCQRVHEMRLPERPAPPRFLRSVTAGGTGFSLVELRGFEPLTFSLRRHRRRHRCSGCAVHPLRTMPH